MRGYQHSHSKSLAANVRHLCDFGFSSEIVVPAICEAIGESLAYDLAEFEWSIDGRLSNYYATPTFGVASGHRIDIDFGNRARAGRLLLYRRDDPFTAPQRDQLVRLRRYLAYAIGNPTPAPADNFVDSLDSGIFTMRGERIVHSSEAAKRLLLLAAHEHLTPEVLAFCPANIGLVYLLRTLQGCARAEHTNRWGRFTFQCHALSIAPEADLWAVHVCRQEPLVVRRSRALRRYALSPQQSACLGLLVEGLNNPQIAGRLGVSTNTANYHVKQVYAKLRVHSRAEAMLLINGAST